MWWEFQRLPQGGRQVLPSDNSRLAKGIPLQTTAHRIAARLLTEPPVLTASAATTDDPFLVLSCRELNVSSGSMASARATGERAGWWPAVA